MRLSKLSPAWLAGKTSRGFRATFSNARRTVYALSTDTEVAHTPLGRGI